MVRGGNGKKSGSLSPLYLVAFETHGNSFARLQIPRSERSDLKLLCSCDHLMALQVEDERQTFWIKPLQPTLLEGISSIELPTRECLFFSSVIPVAMHLTYRLTAVYMTGIDVGWMYPGPLDVRRLREAIAKALQRYPQAAGRLSHNKATGRWNLNISDQEGVPLRVVPNTDAPSPFSPGFDHQRHPDLVGRLCYSNH